MRQAKLSGFGDTGGMYDCQYEWANDCSLQCGGRGVVFSNQGNYRTAFFEAFPKKPDSFIRGEGKTIEEAENNAWEKYQKIMNCKIHEYERRGYTNGVGFCKHCNLQDSKAFEPEQYCKVCSQPTNWANSKKGEWFCELHVNKIPEEDRYSWHKEDLTADEILEMMFS